jgi:uncharacterized protein
MQPDRNQAVDMVRTVALIGIAVVNLPIMALPPEAMLNLPISGSDRVAVLLVEGLFQAKFFLLFSFIFGWGMEIQALSAQRAGASFARRFSRRLMMLALFGTLHALLVFTGDILLLYALLGIVAWVLKGASTRNLMIIAAGLIPVAVLCLALLAILLSEFPLSTAGPSLGGNFAEAVLARWRDWPGAFVFLLLFQGHLALAAFLVGMAAARSGFFEAGNTDAAKLKHKVPTLLALGLLVNGCYVLGSLAGEANPAFDLLGFCCLALGGPILSAAYLGLILRASEAIRLPDWAVLAGRNSLSCYVLQGVLAGLVLGGHGLGLFGSLGQMNLLPISLAVAFASMTLVANFARRFGHGPLEAILRRVTYG